MKEKLTSILFLGGTRNLQPVEICPGHKQVFRNKVRNLNLFPCMHKIMLKAK